MSARSDLADLIRSAAPESWDVIGVGKRLRPFTDSGKDVAVVIEQRGIEASPFSSDGATIPVVVTLVAWVIVDGSRGDDEDEVEDRLDAAAVSMIRILEPFAQAAWDGMAERNAYDAQKPAYTFTIRFDGSITQEEVTP